MTNTELESRISILETEMALIKSKIEKNEETKTPWWEEIAGTFADDPIYDEAMRLGREYRLAQREDYDKEAD
jgi:hypothetical protein